jgi:multidrug transporter EmrE-like cation transporter
VKRGLDIAYSVGNGVFYGAANLISLICLSHVDPSAQFPILTGGSIVMAGVVGRLFFREKITLRFVIATVLVIGATLLLLPWGEFIGA